MRNFIRRSNRRWKVEGVLPELTYVRSGWHSTHAQEARVDQKGSRFYSWFEALFLVDKLDGSLESVLQNLAKHLRIILRPE